jgi:hypothetical protein
MAGPIGTGNIPKALWPGIFEFFGTGYDDGGQEWKALVEVFPSDMNYEELVGVTGFGMAPQKPEGAPTVYDSQTQGFVTRAIHVAYGLGFQVTYEEKKDNLYKKVAQERAQALGFSFRQTKENVVANLYNRAFNANYTIADGVSWANTAHPLVAGGTFSNTLAVPADLSEAALEDMIIQAMGYVDDRGLLINVMPRKLIVPRQEKFNAERILKAVGQPDTSNNNPNAMRNLGSFPEGMAVDRYLSSAHAFFIRTNLPSKQQPILFERESLSFSEDNDFGTKNQLYVGYERYSVVVSDPRSIIASNGP